MESDTARALLDAASAGVTGEAMSAAAAATAAAAAAGAHVVGALGEPRAICHDE